MVMGVCAHRSRYLCTESGLQSLVQSENEIGFTCSCHLSPQKHWLYDEWCIPTRILMVVEGFSVCFSVLHPQFAFRFNSQNNLRSNWELPITHSCFLMVEPISAGKGRQRQTKDRQPFTLTLILSFTAAILSFPLQQRLHNRASHLLQCQTLDATHEQSAEGDWLTERDCSAPEIILASDTDGSMNQQSTKSRLLQLSFIR